ncbi:MAG: hypothetical protein V4671_04610 [Armatimonadota bacterium]
MNPITGPLRDRTREKRVAPGPQDARRIRLQTNTDLPPPVEIGLMNVLMNVGSVSCLCIFIYFGISICF